MTEEEVVAAGRGVRWERTSESGDCGGFRYYFDKFILPNGEAVCILRTREGERTRCRGYTSIPWTR